MKTKFIMFCLSALVCSAAAGCNDKLQNFDLQDGVDVPFELYSLDMSGEDGGIDGSWVNLDYIEGQHSALMINSDRELRRHIRGDYHPIDFSKKTLVLAYGCESGIIVADGHKFQHVSGGNFEMTANLNLTLAAAMFEWHVAIVVDKIPSNSKIKLNTVLVNLL